MLCEHRSQDRQGLAYDRIEVYLTILPSCISGARQIVTNDISHAPRLGFNDADIFLRTIGEFISGKELAISENSIQWRPEFVSNRTRNTSQRGQRCHPIHIALQTQE